MTIKTKRYPRKGPFERAMVTFAILMDQNKKNKKAVYTGYLTHHSFLKAKKNLVKKGNEASAKKKLLYHVNQDDIYFYIYYRNNRIEHAKISFIFGIFTMIEDKIKKSRHHQVFIRENRCVYF